MDFKIEIKIIDLLFVTEIQKSIFNGKRGAIGTISRQKKKLKIISRKGDIRN